LLIAVVAQKLSLRREEKYVHTFALNIELAKKRRNQAANVVKYAIKAWFLRHRNRRRTVQYFQAQRKLFSSISDLQQTKRQQASLVDHCVGLHELITLQRITGDNMEETVQQVAEIQSYVNKVDEQLVHFNSTLSSLQATLNALLEMVNKQYSNKNEMSH
jgi:hypothetical protein